MRAVRVYKDNLREHIFRTLFFTDTVLFIGTGIILAVVVVIIYRFLFQITQTGLILSTIFLIELFFALIATLKIEKQPLFKIIPRVVLFQTSQKQLTKKQSAKTTGDFKIFGNHIIRRKKLIAVFEIHPFDIALLNDEERERYYHHIKTMLHTLPGKVQLIVRKEKAKVDDYHKHFYSLFETANPKLDWLINIYVKELSTLININEFQIIKYYAVFSTPLISENERHISLAAQQLTDMGNRFSGSLALEKIYLTQLSQTELIEYFKKQFRDTV